jgi:7-cyano-7-deazaguanine synthase in queuosine biosynthesis
MKQLPTLSVDVCEPESSERDGWIRCAIGENLEFSTLTLESFFFSTWNPAVYDALLVAAAVEFCDLTKARNPQVWARSISLKIPVHEPDRWNEAVTHESLCDALEFLTGDRWNIEFDRLKMAAPQPRQGPLSLPREVRAVIPYSNGLDSRAVAGLRSQDLNGSLVRVRLGGKREEDQGEPGARRPFTAVPYTVTAAKGHSFRESSARSRGFKFALISGVAAYLAQTTDIIVPESGQGALGPSLVAVGQAYADYRSHPLFTRRMERFLRALLGAELKYQFPQIWLTKGETLSAYMKLHPKGHQNLADTHSCWQQARQVGVSGKKRQCGVCAACMLRRLSMHTIGLKEERDVYVWESLNADEFVHGISPAFPLAKVTKKMRDYAIAGTLHLDHLATLHKSPSNESSLSFNAFQLSRACGLPEADVRRRVDRLLSQHEAEWGAFVDSLSRSSFVRRWIASAQ